MEELSNQLLEVKKELELKRQEVAKVKDEFSKIFTQLNKIKKEITNKKIEDKNIKRTEKLKVAEFSNFKIKDEDVGLMISFIDKEIFSHSMVLDINNEKINRVFNNNFNNREILIFLERAKRKTFSDIGEKFTISPKRARDIFNNVVKRLKHPDAGKEFIKNESN